VDFSSINWLAVVVCVIVQVIVGSTYFSNRGLFPMWWEAIGKPKMTQAQMSIPAQSMITQFAIVIGAAIVISIFMALMVNAMGKMTGGGATLASGATAGFLLWLGFVAPTGISNRVFAGQLKAWVIEAGYHLINFVIMGAILGAWH
jgi:uncharacterized protein DUF1761